MLLAAAIATLMAALAAAARTNLVGSSDRRTIMKQLYTVDNYALPGL
jgi:hypothetical protein